MLSSRAVLVCAVMLAAVTLAAGQQIEERQGYGVPSVQTDGVVYADLPAAPQQDYLLPTVSQIHYRAPSTAPEQSYGAPAAPEPSYGAPAAPEPSYGAPAAPEPGYGAPAAPESGYGAPAAPESGYGTPSAPKSGYGAPAAPESDYGAPATPEPSYGAPAVSESGYETSAAPESGYGAPAAPKSGYGAAAAPESGYGAPAAARSSSAAPAAGYGSPAAPSLEASFSGAVGYGLPVVAGSSGGKCRADTKFILTWTKAVLAVTLYDTRSEHVPTTLYKYITETERFPVTMVTLETKTETARPEYREETRITYRTLTKVLPQVDVVTSTLLIPEDEHVTVTETDHVTQTVLQRYPVEVTSTSVVSVAKVGRQTGERGWTGRSGGEVDEAQMMLGMVGRYLGYVFLEPQCSWLSESGANFVAVRSANCKCSRAVYL